MCACLDALQKTSKPRTNSLAPSLQHACRRDAFSFGFLRVLRRRSKTLYAFRDLAQRCRAARDHRQAKGLRRMRPQLYRTLEMRTESAMRERPQIIDDVPD